MIDFGTLSHILARLFAATVLGGFLGAEREIHGRWAGFRTHMMVAMGSAMFVIAGTEIASSSPAELTRVIQGVATGIGFLGAGTILQLSDRMEVKGLTTAASVWSAAAVGTAAGLGQYELAVGGTLVSIVVLSLLRPLDQFFAHKGKGKR